MSRPSTRSWAFNFPDSTKLFHRDLGYNPVYLALAIGCGIFREKLDRGLVVDMDDALGNRSGDHEPQLLESEGGGVQQLPDMIGHIGIDALVTGGRDKTVRVWVLPAYAAAPLPGEVHRFAGHTGPVERVAVSPDGSAAASCGG